MSVLCSAGVIFFLYLERVPVRALARISRVRKRLHFYVSFVYITMINFIAIFILRFSNFFLSFRENTLHISFFLSLTACVCVDMRVLLLFSRRSDL